MGRFLIPITAKSGEGETTINLTINVVPDSLYWQWASDFFDRTIPEGISLENLQPDANLDQDGVNNLIELAFLTDPTSPTDHNLPVKSELTQIAGAKSLTISLEQRVGAGNLFELKPTRSIDLADGDRWIDIPENEFQLNITPATRPEIEVVEFIIELDLTPAQYFRIEARSISNQ
ncbi:MAG: hypothetical protein ACJA16_004063 [Akkermansiaceae bacterium]